MRQLLSLLCILGFSHAHTTFTNFFINGAPQGDGTCVRMSHTPQNATFPLPDITAPEMACGVNGDIGVARVCSAPSGALMTFEFRERPDGKEPGAIDKSHKGPIAIYMKKVADPTANGTAAGDGWFKIFQADFDDSKHKWATETLIANNGLLSVNLPKAIAGGYYLVRTELLALHDADKSPPDPQFYVGCAQVFLQSGGSTEPPNKVKIPGYIDLDKNRAALTFNVWKTPMALPYPMFGPQVFTGASTRQRSISKAVNQTLGTKPDDCVLVNANWCGQELAAYTTEKGCWNASTACWAQSNDCYSEAPPTGSANCKIWEDKCKGIQQQCNAKNFNGPPNQMKDLTPKNKQADVPPAANAQNDATPAVDSSSPTSSAAASRKFTLQQDTASASGASGRELTTTLHRTSFETVVKTIASNSALPSASASASKTCSKEVDSAGAASNTAAPTSSSSPDPAASPAAAAASGSDDANTTTSASASASAAAYASSSASASGAAPSSQQNAALSPDAFGSVDECGARNASAHCGAALCCSQFGFCGATDEHCGIGCQDGFGACDQLPANSTAAGASGSDNGSSSSGSSSGTDAASPTSISTTATAAAGAASTSTTSASPDSSTAPLAAASSAAPRGGAGSDGAEGTDPPADTPSNAPSPPAPAPAPAAVSSSSSNSIGSTSISIPGPTSSVTVVILGVDNSEREF